MWDIFVRQLSFRTCFSKTRELLKEAEFREKCKMGVGMFNELGVMEMGSGDEVGWLWCGDGDGDECDGMGCSWTACFPPPSFLLPLYHP